MAHADAQQRVEDEAASSASLSPGSNPSSRLAAQRAPAGARSPPSLHHARRQVAQAIGAAGRKMWRRADLTAEDELISELLCEALARLSKSLRGPAGCAARELLQSAPQPIRQEVLMLAAIAKRGVPPPAAFKVAPGAPVRSMRADADEFVPTLHLRAGAVTGRARRWDSQAAGRASLSTRRPCPGTPGGG